MMARDANERSAATSSALPQRTDELVAEHDAFGNLLKETSGAPHCVTLLLLLVSPSAASGKKSYICHAESYLRSQRRRRC